MKAKTNLKEPNPGAVYWSTMSGEAHSGYYLRTIWSYFGGKKSFAKWFCDEVASGHFYEVNPNEEMAEALAERIHEWADDFCYTEVTEKGKTVAEIKRDLLLAGKENEELERLLFEACEDNDDYFSELFELQQDLDEFIQSRRVWLQIQYDNWLSK